MYTAAQFISYYYEIDEMATWPLLNKLFRKKM